MWWSNVIIYCIWKKIEIEISLFLCYFISGDNMKIMFISDIHGLTTNLELIDTRFRELHCDTLVVLGDLYLSSEMADYDPKAVREFLTAYKDKMICMKGNCDTNIDVEVSPFQMIDGYYKLQTINHDLYLTHGHVYNEKTWDKTNSILIFGHYHVPFIEKIETNYYINPGSISKPHNNFEASYMIYDEEKFTIYDIHNNILFEEKIN